MKKAAVSPMHDHVTIEYWGIAGEEGGLTRGGGNGSFSEGAFQNDKIEALTTLVAFHTNNTYKAMRIVSPDYDILYTVWCSHEHEVYDMKVFQSPFESSLPTCLC